MPPAARLAAINALAPAERRGWLESLGQGDAVTLVRDLRPADRDRLLDELASTRTFDGDAYRAGIVIALAPPVPRIRARVVGVEFKTGEVALTDAGAERLRGLGIDVRDGSNGRDGCSVYLGLRLEAARGPHVERLDAWTARLEVDRDLAEAIAAGQVIVEDVPADESRAASLNEWRFNKRSLPSIDGPR
jgi:hypothetical protein